MKDIREDACQSLISHRVDPYGLYKILACLDRVAGLHAIFSNINIHIYYWHDSWFVYGARILRETREYIFTSALAIPTQLLNHLQIDYTGTDSTIYL